MKFDGNIQTDYKDIFFIIYVFNGDQIGFIWIYYTNLMTNVISLNSKINV